MLTNKKSGIIKLILLIIIAVLLLSYFGISLRKIANSQMGQDNFGFIKEIGLKIWTFSVSIWDKYLAEKVMFVWDDVIIKYGWNFVTENIDKLRN